MRARLFYVIQVTSSHFASKLEALCNFSFNYSANALVLPLSGCRYALLVGNYSTTVYANLTRSDVQCCTMSLAPADSSSTTHYFLSVARGMTCSNSSIILPTLQPEFDARCKRMPDKNEPTTHTIPSVTVHYMGFLNFLYRLDD